MIVYPMFAIKLVMIAVGTIIPDLIKQVARSLCTLMLHLCTVDGWSYYEVI